MEYAETKYANDYVTMTHKSPFATIKTIVEPPKKWNHWYRYFKFIFFYNVNSYQIF